MAMPTSDWFLIACYGRTLDIDSVMEALSERARQLVDEFWEPIASIAAALVTRDQISQSEAMSQVMEYRERLGVDPSEPSRAEDAI